MSAAELTVVDLDAGPVALALGVLTVPAFRSSGLCIEQVERLMAEQGSWQPILVRRADLTVVDGAHRVEAARRLGGSRIEAVFFDGDAEAAFVEFVRRNVSQGLVLTLDERKRAAKRVLTSHSAWSDRRIAELCVLSPKTVGAIRRRLTVERGETDGRSVREGRDGKVRPVQRGSARARALDVLRDRPEASLRSVASEAGVSPETVRTARRDLEPRPHAVSAAGSPIRRFEARGETPDSSDRKEQWRTDVALTSSERGAELIAWLERTELTDGDKDLINEVPLGRVYVVAEEARRRAEAWLALARALEARPSMPI